MTPTASPLNVTVGRIQRAGRIELRGTTGSSGKRIVMYRRIGRTGWFVRRNLGSASANNGICGLMFPTRPHHALADARRGRGHARIQARLEFKHSYNIKKTDGHRGGFEGALGISGLRYIDTVDSPDLK